MSNDEVPAGEPSATDLPPRAGSVGDPLKSWLAANRGRITDEALIEAAVAAGYADEAVRTAIAKADDAVASAPVRARARRIVTVMYVGGYIVLVGGMVGFARYGTPTATVASLILGATMGIAFLAANIWLGQRVKTASVSRALPMLLSVPVLLWIAVAGLCVSTGYPLPSAPAPSEGPSFEPALSAPPT